MNSNKIKIEISMEVMERVVIQLIFSRMILILKLWKERVKKNIYIFFFSTSLRIAPLY
jgi:hypothetical protein